MEAVHSQLLNKGPVCTSVHCKEPFCCPFRALEGFLPPESSAHTYKDVMPLRGASPVHML